MNKFKIKRVLQRCICILLLFLVFINDINYSCTAKVISFADDTTMFTSNSNVFTLFAEANEAAKNLYIWFCSNYLYLNATKTKYMIFTSPKTKIPPNINLFINDLPIQRVGTHNEEGHFKFLGLILDENLTYKYHLNAINNKINQTIFAMKQIKHQIPQNSLTSLYYALIHPHLT